MNPELSTHFRDRQPSAIRSAQLLFEQRPDRDAMQVINLAIGNVSWPMHPAMRRRMATLAAPEGPFGDGAVRYTSTAGTEEARAAFRNVIATSGVDAGDLHVVVTDGGSAAMELALLGACGPASERPILLVDPAYSNYADIAKRVAVPVVSARRELGDDGAFGAPDPVQIEALIARHRPRALVVIPADNPTGQSLTMEQLAKVAAIAVDHGLWVISDEAYRQLHYGGGASATVWALDERTVPGLGERRISIESSSKVFNACGLRIGALATDNAELGQRAVAEYTANLCANAIGQHIFGALAHVTPDELGRWYDEQRQLYAGMAKEFVHGLRTALPDAVVSRPDAGLYTVVDVRRTVAPGFAAREFVRWCAREGKVMQDGVAYTLLVAPMDGFYRGGTADPAAASQMRIAYVAKPAEMRRAPALFAELLDAYERTRADSLAARG